jgi:hypothetical protein
MILPSKHISQEKALLTIGAELLKVLNRPKTISTIWEQIHLSGSLSYDWFILALDLLYTIDAIELNAGLISRRKPL